MIILALDTTANLCSAALYDSDRAQLLSLKSEDIGRGHAERLMGLLHDVLQDSSLEYRHVDRIAVTTGPGSFTGIRVGLATARGLALGLAVPITGVSVLDAIAFQHRQTEVNIHVPLVVAMDAKRDEIAMQQFESEPNASRSPIAVPIDQISKYLPKRIFRLAGSAADLVVTQTGRKDIEVCSNQNAADIEAVINRAAQMPQTDEKPKPLYLRQPDAKPQRDFVLPRVVSGR